MKKQFTGFIMAAIFLYVMMTISSTIERSVAVKVGSHYSPAFAEQIRELNDWRTQLRKTDPQGAEHMNLMIIVARDSARAAIAILAAALMFSIAKLGAARRQSGMTRKDEPGNDFQPTRG